MNEISLLFVNFFSFLANGCCVFFFLSQTEAHLDTLISEQASFILARSGIGSLYTVYQENRGQRVRSNSFLGVLSIELT